MAFDLGKVYRLPWQPVHLRAISGRRHTERGILYMPEKQWCCSKINYAACEASSMMFKLVIEHCSTFNLLWSKCWLHNAKALEYGHHRFLDWFRCKPLLRSAHLSRPWVQPSTQCPMKQAKFTVNPVCFEISIMDLNVEKTLHPDSNPGCVCPKQ